MPEGTVKKIILHFMLISVGAVVLFWGNTLSRQQTQFTKGEQALARGNEIDAISGFSSAIHLYTPGSSLTNAAADRLWALGERLERGGDTERSLIAYRSLRSACYAIRGLTSPCSGWIARCDEKLAKLADGTMSSARSSGHGPPVLKERQ
ncbi:MAG TPA: hypothetical protein PLI53_04405 [Geobacteraceae bacterium]|nr:hypothetical protein [Geobacteraceae bacterium]